MLKSIAVIFVLLSTIALLPCSESLNFDYCNKKQEYEVKVSKVEISPSPLVRDYPATFNISANTDEEIREGTLVADVSFFGIHIHQESHELCEETRCPVSTGGFLISHTQVLPSFTPPGSYRLTMGLRDKKGHQLTCIHFDFTIGFGNISTALFPS